MKDPITSMAPRGKRCTRCLCCDAVIVFDGEALCATCDDGTHAPLHELHNKFESGAANCPAQEEGEATPTGSIARAATSPKPSNSQPLKEQQMRNRVTDEQKQQIADSSPEESCGSIGKRLGLPTTTVVYQREMILQRAGAVGNKPAKKKPEVSRVKSSEKLAPREASATFLVTDKTVDAWWSRLPLGKKAEIFAGNYVIRLEGAVS